MQLFLKRAHSPSCYKRRTLPDGKETPSSTLPPLCAGEETKCAGEKTKVCQNASYASYDLGSGKTMVVFECDLIGPPILNKLIIKKVIN